MSGWLTTPKPTQFVTVRCRQTPARLTISQAEGAAAPRIENHLGSRIQHLVLRDAAGRAFKAQDVAADQAIELAPDDSANPLQAISDAYVRNHPRAPRDLNSAAVMVQRRFESAEQQSLGHSRLEAQLLEAQQTLGPRSYVAVVDRSPEVQFGTQPVSEEAGFHVVVGHW